MFGDPYYKRLGEDEWFDELRINLAPEKSLNPFTDHLRGRVASKPVAPLLRLVTEYRFKTSDLSGNEWRISTMWQISVQDGWADFHGPWRNLETAVIAIYPGMFTSHPAMHSLKVDSCDFFRKGVLLYRMSYGVPETALKMMDFLGHLPWALQVAFEQSGGVYSWHRLTGTQYESKCFQPGCSENATSVYQLVNEYAEGHGWVPEIKTLRAFCARHLDRGNSDFEDCNDNYVVVSGEGPDKAHTHPEDESPAAFGGVIQMPSEE